MVRSTVFMDWKTHEIKMPILPKSIYKTNAILIKIPAKYFVYIDKFFQKCMESKGSTIAKTIAKKKNEVKSMPVLDVKIN